jgi:hypothetical protein
MRIASVTPIPVTLPTEREPMSFFFVRVETDNGLVGRGEASDSFGCSFAVPSVGPGRGQRAVVSGTQSDPHDDASSEGATALRWSTAFVGVTVIEFEAASAIASASMMRL